MSSINTLLYATVAIVGLIVIILFVSNANTFVTSLFDDNSCYASVRQHAAAMEVSSLPRTLPGGESLAETIASRIDCPTRRDTIDGTKDRIQEQLAEKMVACWRSWGRGELELFAREEGAYCHVCNIVSFDRDVTIDNFLYYLTTNPASGDTYLQQMSEYSTDEIDTIGREIQEREMPVIETDKDYGIVFRYIKGKDMDNYYNEYIGQYIDQEVQTETIHQSIGIGSATATTYLGTRVGGALCSIIPGGGTLTCGAGGGVLGAAAGIYIYGEATDNQQWYADVNLIPYDEENLQRLGCGIAPE